jgi:hypothetical protein
MALPTRTPSPQLFERITARIDQHATHQTVQRPAVARGASSLTRRQRLLSYAVAASVFLSLSAGSLWLLRPSDDQAAAQRAVEKLAEHMGELRQMEQLLKSDTVRLVSLHRPDEPKTAQAYVLWDVSAGQWHFFADHLPPPPAGQTYQLWAEDKDGHRLPGPTFQVNAEGLGSAVADMPGLSPKAAVKAIVTLEPAAGSQQPTGKVILEAAL